MHVVPIQAFKQTPIHIKEKINFKHINSSQLYTEHSAFIKIPLKIITLARAGTIFECATS